MKSRHLAREIALQILYRHDVLSVSGRSANPASSPPQIAEPSLSTDSLLPKGLDPEADLILHFKHFKVPEELQQFAAELVKGTLKALPELDLLLEKHAKNWKVSRMGFVDRNLLRMALFELGNFPDIPANVTLDEAVELAKQFGTEETPAFVNAILDSIKKEKL